MGASTPQITVPARTARMTTTPVAPPPSGPPAPNVSGRPRAPIAARTLRTDRYWVEPAVTVAVLVSFIVYSTIRAFANTAYWADPYISPFYSPCLTSACPAGQPAPGDLRRLGLPHPGASTS